MKSFFQNNQLLIYSTAVLTMFVCVVVGVFLLVEQQNIEETYYEDGTLERKNYYRSNESLEKVEFYSTKGALVQVAYYKPNGTTLKFVEVFSDDGILQFKNYYRADNTSERFEEYRPDGTLFSVTHTDSCLLYTSPSPRD